MKFLCDNCKAKYQIADDKVAGKTVRMKCRKCGHQIEVRAAVTETSVTSSPPRPLSEAPRAPQKNSLATSLSAAKPRTPSQPHGSSAGALAGAFQRQVQDAPTSIAPPAQANAVELSVTDEWYVAINGVPVGPVRISELRRKAGAGAVNEDSLCWQEGLEEWRPIRSIPELAALVREAMQGNRPSLLAPEPPRAPAGGPPRPPARPAAPAAPKVSEPPRPAAPSPPAGPPPRSNVVPFRSPNMEDAAPLTSPLGGGAAAARAPAFAPSPAPSASIAPAVDPFAINPVVPTPAPPPAVDPFAIPPPPAAPAMAAPAPTMSTSPSIPPGYMPMEQKRGVPLWFWPILLLALGFGGTVAFLVFRPQPAPAPVVIQMPPTATATAEKPSEVPPPPPSAEPTAAPAETGKKSGAVAAAPRPAPTTPEKKTADISGLLGGTGGPSAGGGSGPSAAGGGGFDQAAVERVVANHRAGVKRTCWERVSGPDQKSSVNVTVNATVAPNGTVSSTSSNGDDPVVAKCIENQVRTWQFPAPGESKQIALPFKFVRQ